VRVDRSRVDRRLDLGGRRGLGVTVDGAGDRPELTPHVADRHVADRELHARVGRVDLPGLGADGGATDQQGEEREGKRS
jgi:hypothetical protein